MHNYNNSIQTVIQNNLTKIYFLVSVGKILLIMNTLLVVFYTILIYSFILNKISLTVILLH